MIVSKCLGILFMAIMAATVSGKENHQRLVRVRPITREQYENILKINEGKPVISEARLINSAVTGLAGLAAGFQLSKLWPTLFGSTSAAQDAAMLGGYPLCTINSDQASGRQLEEPPYLDVDELTNSLARPENATSEHTLIHCILVLDDGKDTAEKPATATTTTKPATTTTTTTTTTKPKTTVVPHYPQYPHHPSVYPSIYPGYPFYPYPPPVYPLPPPAAYYPIPFPTYIQYPTSNPKPNAQPQTVNSINLHTALLNKIPAIRGLSTTTTKAPKQRSGRRTTPGPQAYPQSQYYSTIDMKTRRQIPKLDLDEYDDSVDYIEVSKNSSH